MKEIIIQIVHAINNIHDMINYMMSEVFHTTLTDKDLHFWIMGIIGFVVFLFVLFVSNAVAKLPYGIVILAFLYTFTFMVVLVFAIEIQQAITNRGNMEFQDAVVGLYGYLAFFFMFAFLSGIFLLGRKIVRGKKNKH
ncbi:hypothetical protein OEV98_05570 [Caldibacillus lycopersici]|uniref:Uncharacterized protein n=1 Tax=Perspicuibacillus lycopersici TaxID=1325689 RepID=A0AAE3LSR1_9BACI|nr:hypothetical protein [Perspicuibacillus lycopersici]MCU9613018.1 hypothetical protein [Perspicuibacillus lycopersici]